MPDLWQQFKPERIKLDLEVEWPTDAKGNPLPPRKAIWIIKSKVIDELVSLHEKSGFVQNRNRLFKDLLNREKRATTGIGNGVAVPHVRTLQVRDVSVCFAKSNNGIEFEAVDGEPCYLFFSIVAPPYNDQDYLKFFSKIASMLQYESVREALRNAETPDEVIRIIKQNEQ